VLERVLTDGRVSIRPSSIDDVPALIAGRDAEFERFLGPGSPDPRPVACIVVPDQQVDAVLLLDHLTQDTNWRVATLLIHPDNDRSLALARRAGFGQCGDLDGNPYWKKRLDERPDGI
jgi:hypothetical protein